MTKTTINNDRRRRKKHSFGFLKTIFLIGLMSYISFFIWLWTKVHTTGISSLHETMVALPWTKPFFLNTSNKLPPPNDTQPREQNDSLPRVLAIVFPQYHREPLNDQFWGEGFTDWDNLRSAPLKNRLGFSIPRPTELGYYDYTNPFTRKLQGELARQHDVDGFVFHHYWFYDEAHPGPNLHAPLEALLKDGYPDIPFCLHWCNEKWMNTWHGKTREGFDMPATGILQKQYFPENTTQIAAHYDWLRRFFHHPNYIKVRGQPVLMVYHQKPRSFAVLQQLRTFARTDGFSGLYFALGLTRPHQHLLPLGKKNPPRYQKLSRVPFDVFNKTVAYPNPAEWNERKVFEIPDWCRTSSPSSNKPVERTVEIAGILIAFDNTPRRDFQEAYLWSADEPTTVVDRFRKSLYAALYYETCCFSPEKKETKKEEDDRFILINSMNEWAEGMAMEPSDVFGRFFLEAVRDAKQDVRLMDGQCGIRKELQPI